MSSLVAKMSEPQSAQEKVSAVIAALRGSLELEVRSAEAGRLDAVIGRSELEVACAILEQALGPPAKPFGVMAKFDAPTSFLGKTIGGIKKQQCLHLKSEGSQHVIYAALWPWESDPEKISVRLGICDRPAS